MTNTIEIITADLLAETARDRGITVQALLQIIFKSRAMFNRFTAQGEPIEVFETGIRSTEPSLTESVLM